MNTTLVKEVIEIARLAGEAVIKIYDASEHVVYTKKDDDSPLTQADSASNDVICAGLEKLSEKYPIISEENKSIEYDERKNFGHYWLVDPLDGTKEFIKRNGEFTVNIALVKDGAPIFGVVYAPILEQMFWAYKGHGAFLIENGEEKRLQAKSFKMSDKNLGVVCSRSHLNEETQNFVDALDKPELVAKGSSLKFLILATGNAHLYPRLAPTMEWDTGAAQIVLEEAGGKVLQADTKNPLEYNKENLLNPSFIAYGKLVE